MERSWKLPDNKGSKKPFIGLRRGNEHYFKKVIDWQKYNDYHGETMLEVYEIFLSINMFYKKRPAKVFLIII